MATSASHSSRSCRTSHALSYSADGDTASLATADAGANLAPLTALTSLILAANLGTASLCLWAVACCAATYRATSNPRRQRGATNEGATPIRRTTTTAVTVLAVALALAGSAGATTVAQAKKEIRRLWGPNATRAFCIVARESNWDPKAVSRTNDHGLFQLNAIHARAFGSDWAHRYDPVENVRMAFRLYKAAGFSPWAGGRYSC